MVTNPQRKDFSQWSFLLVKAGEAKGNASETWNWLKK